MTAEGEAVNGREAGGENDAWVCVVGSAWKAAELINRMR